MIKRMTEEERRRRRRKDLGFSIIMAIFVVIMMGISFVGGYWIGTKATVSYFMNAMTLIFENSDIKINMNMTFNQTQMIDYMFQKLNNSGLLNSSVPQKEYFPPCNPDPSIPRGETGRCIEQQQIK